MTAHTTTAVARLRDAATNRRDFTPFYRSKVRREFRGKLRLSDLDIEAMSFTSMVRDHEPPTMVISPNCIVGKIHPTGSFTYIGKVR